MRRPARERQIFAICKRVGEPAFTDFLMPASLDYMQNYVSGYIETVTFDDMVVICNEFGRIRGLDYNATINDVDFVGNIIICGEKGENFASLPFKYVRQFLNLLNDEDFNLLNGEDCNIFGGDEHARR